jgi:uncharacterized protein YecE (DUF72 family)
VNGEIWRIQPLPPKPARCCARTGSPESLPIRRRRPKLNAPAAFGALIYSRLHGSPRIYYSPYSERDLNKIAAALSTGAARERWCVFDNTASGAARANALDLRERIGDRRE